MLNKYQSVFETTLDGIILISNRGIIEDVNSAGLKLFGYHRDEIIGENVKCLMPEPDRGNHDLYIKNYQRTSVPKIIGIGREVEGKRKDGSLFPFRLAVSEFYSDGVQFFTGIIHDLTQQKLHEKIITGYAEELEKRVYDRTIELQKEIELKETAQKALIESQKLYQTIAENYPNGTISVVDSQFKTVFAEGSEFEKLDIPKEEIYERDYRLNIPIEYRDFVSSKLEYVLQGEAQDFEYGNVEYAYRVRCVPLAYEADVVEQILIVENNITEQKRAESEIYAALNKEKHLNELKTNFVSMASHEFRTPLSSILSSANLVARYTEADQQDNRLKHLQKITRNVQGLTMILNDFLSLEKIEGGYIKHNPEITAVKDFMEQVKEEAETITKKNQQVHMELDVTIESKPLDTYLLRNAITNLLSNAIKYSDEDIYISVKSHKEFSVSVKDKGIGIADADQVNLFNRFYRASNAGQIQGTGLGLNIVKRYVDIMGGRINFESKLNEGSTFTIIL